MKKPMLQEWLFNDKNAEKSRVEKTSSLCYNSRAFRNLENKGDI
jgi:hypothetical protein